ncbi:MAG TPA: glycosyltransferase [Thermodesulfobacteriota bacterium]
MTGAPSVDIVVNNYNYGRFLRAAIDGALGQTYPHTTVIVVDDGSTDDSRDVIASYGDRIVPVLKPNGGQASACNAGLAAGRGDLVIFLDADDCLLPEAASRVARAWRPGVAVVQYRLQVLNRDGVPEPAFNPTAHSPMPNGDLRRHLLSHFDYTRPPMSGCCYSREALARFFPVPERTWRYSADAYISGLAALLGEVVSLDEPLGFYRVHGQNAWVNFRPNFEERLVHEVRCALEREAAMVALARTLGLPVEEHLALRNVFHAKLRVALRVAYPERYPRPDESPFWLASRSIRAAWQPPRGGVRDLAGRLAVTAWLALLPALPRRLARGFARFTLVRRRASQFRRQRRAVEAAARGDGPARGNGPGRAGE